MANGSIRVPDDFEARSAGSDHVKRLWGLLSPCATQGPRLSVAPQKAGTRKRQPAEKGSAVESSAIDYRVGSGPDRGSDVGSPRRAT